MQISLLYRGSRVIISPMNYLRSVISLVSLSMMFLSCEQQTATRAIAQAAPAMAISQDCTASASTLPKGTKRVYIALRNGKDGTGMSPDDARDGSSAESFDTILRCYSEGCQEAKGPHKAVAKTDDLMVCLGPGTFQTKGSYDFMILRPHTTQQGFTVGRGWKIHGRGPAQTTLQLADYLPITDPKNPQNMPVGTGWNTVISTNSDGASGVEISDLTLDANYPSLKSLARKNGTKALNLEAIHLRSDLGGHWIHNVNVINAAGEIGGLNPAYETFPAGIVSLQKHPPSAHPANIIEPTTMSGFGGCR